MERDKQIKLAVAGVIGLAAVVILAMNFLGGGKKPKAVEPDEPAAQQLSTRGQSPKPERD
ncbi:MAG: hypothetical protein IT431_04395 [Phycisphaerales bacterium]|nr:hypothetical protein [Phycisphaerales bacterium]